MFLNSLKQNRKKGFTIIELLVVISIIGLLSTISVVSLNGARIKSRDAKRVSDISQLKTAIELYFNDQGYYPAEGVPVSLGTGTKLVLCDVGFVASASSCNSNKIYMGKVPRNPGPNGMEYTYTSITSSENYNLAYSLEQGTSSLPSGYNTVDGGNGSTTSDPLEQGLVAYYPLNEDSEITGADILSPVNFTNWASNGGATFIAPMTSTTSAGPGGPVKAVLTIGKKYTLRIIGSTTATNIQVDNSSTGGVNRIGDYLTGSFNVTSTFTALTTTIYVRNADNGTTILTTFEIKEVFAGDQSSYANNGSIYGATLAAGVNGEASGAYSFDGVNDYISINIVSSAARTQSGWFYLTATASAKGTYNLLFSNFLQHTNNYLYIQGTADYFNAGFTTINSWYHIALVFTDNTNTSSAILYINGVAKSIVIQPAAHDIDDVTSISSSISSLAFSGSISNVRIYNRALTATEVGLLYSQGR